MAQHTLPGHPPVPVILRRSARARRMSLRISQLDGRVTLTIPTRLPAQEAMDFARSKENWIRSHLDQRPQDWHPEYGAEIPVEGILRRIVPADGRGVTLLPDRVAVPEGSKNRRLLGFLRELARARLVVASDRFSGRLGRSYARLSIRDTRSRWGSCSEQGALNFSWRLVLAPPDVLTYVAAHEVAHLAEMNHSPAFWRRVADIHGPYDAPRQWLRQNGAALHRFRL